MRTSAGRLLPLIMAFALASNLCALTIDIVELPKEGGIRISTDGSLLNFFPGAECAIVPRIRSLAIGLILQLRARTPPRLL